MDKLIWDIIFFPIRVLMWLFVWGFILTSLAFPLLFAAVAIKLLFGG